MYNRDQELIKKLKLNAKGKYKRFGQGDVEYLIDALIQLDKYERMNKGITNKGGNNNDYI